MSLLVQPRIGGPHGPGKGVRLPDLNSSGACASCLSAGALCPLAVVALAEVRRQKANLQKGLRSCLAPSHLLSAGLSGVAFSLSASDLKLGVSFPPSAPKCLTLSLVTAR